MPDSRGSSHPDTAVPPWWPSFEDAEKKRKDDRDAKRLRDVLAESTASDVTGLRLALAEIVVEEMDSRVYGGGCACGGKRSCRGHVSEVMKIARVALGLSPLPDSPRVPMPPDDPKPKRKKKAAPRG